MSYVDVINVVTAVILSIGGGGAIVFGLSAWLGKVWANRLMDAERAKHSQELEKLRSELRYNSEKNLADIKTELDIYKEKHLKGHSDKIAIYRLAVDIVSDLLGDLDLIAMQCTPEDALKRWDKFNRDRMRAYGYIAMLAPQSVMDAFDALFDLLIMVCHGNKKYDWPLVRNLALNLINEIRKDIAIDISPIEYKGELQCMAFIDIL